MSKNKVTKRRKSKNDETKGAIEWLRTLDEDDRDYYDAQRILAHIDDEPARLAAALERANEGVRYWTDLAQAEARDAAALRVRAEKVEADLAAMVEQWKAELNHANAWMRKCQAAEAQVAAARAECERLIDRPWSRWAGDAGRDVLGAMDEAAKK